MKFHRPDMASTDFLQDTASWSQNLECLTWGLARQLEASGVSSFKQHMLLNLLYMAQALKVYGGRSLSAFGGSSGC